MDKLSRRDFLKFATGVTLGVAPLSRKGKAPLISAFHNNHNSLGSSPMIRSETNRNFSTSYRTHLSLDGDWQFQVDPENHADWQTITTWRTAHVPLPWQAQFDDLRQYRGAAWYRRQFQMDEVP